MNVDLRRWTAIEDMDWTFEMLEVTETLQKVSSCGKWAKI
jgi:hypothetical protein